MKWLKETAEAFNMLAPHVIAMMIVSLYAFVQIHILYTTAPIEPTMRDIVMRSLGTLDSALAFVLGWYFGSQNKTVAPPTSATVTVTPEKH